MLNIVGLKSRDVISIPLGIPDVDVLSVELSEWDDYIITVEALWDFAWKGHIWGYSD
jgi:hypothetical protein